MRLQRLVLKNFRSCRDTEIQFPKDVTVLVGENGSGKSNIIDAIRLVTTPASGRRFYYFDAERDLTNTLPSGNLVICRQVFADLTEIEKAIYVPHLVDHHEDLVYTTEFSTDPALPKRFRVRHSVGEAQIPDPEPENRERIACVYLPPLRDAIRELDSADGNRLSEIMRAIGTEEELVNFHADGNTALEALAQSDLPTKALESIQEHLTSITHPARSQRIGIAHRAQDVGRLARLLRMQMGDLGVPLDDLSASGLGYANLLYIATIVIELERAKEFDLTLLLVEEPEAHLHPQLQSILLEYLEARVATSAKEAKAQDDPSPGGRIQVIVSTHSPNIASSLSTENVVIIKKQASCIANKLEPPVTTTVALADIPLRDTARRKIDRYLNVTRCSLLFARQVILVEGLAESLLIKTLAECCVFRPQRNETDERRRQREQYRAITVVAIDSVDFQPYLDLLLTGIEPLAERVVVITDADDGAGHRRKTEYESRYAPHLASGRMSVHVGCTTLEADLFADPGNEAVLRQAYLTLFPRSADRWDKVASEAPDDSEGRAQHFFEAMRQEHLNLRKGDFAHVLSALLADADIAHSFTVPSYLATAIQAALVDASTQFEVVS